MGKLVFQLAGAFAKFERTMIRQRVKAGLKRAVAQGVKLGRPKIDSATERKVRKQLAKGIGMLRVARSLGLGGTVQRIAKDMGERKPRGRPPGGGARAKIDNSSEDAAHQAVGGELELGIEPIEQPCVQRLPGTMGGQIAGGRSS
jgi:hypothetical protein